MILYIIYINDIVHAFDIAFFSKNYECDENTVKTELNKIHEWSCTNKLSINLFETT